MNKRKDGRYSKKVYIGTIDGVKKYKFVYGKSKKECEEKAFQVKLDYKQGIDILASKNKSFSFWCDAFLRNVEAKSTEEWYMTIESRANVWKQHLGDVDIEQIHTCDLEEILKIIQKNNPYRPNKQSSAKTVKEYASIITRIFDFCVQNRVLTFNPTKNMDKPKAPKKVIREPLNDMQIKAIKETEGVMQIPMLIMLYTGVRKGELLALQYRDIDFDNKILSVSKAVNLKQGGKLKSTKTESGLREIPIPEHLIPILKKISKTDFFLINDNGKQYNNNAWEREWARYVKTLNAKYNVNWWFTAHHLRHTYCTLLYEAGVDLETAIYLMGHKDAKVTTEIYTHLREKHKQRNIEKLNAYLSNL